MKAPVLFIGHGSPMNILEENDWTRTWARLGRELGPLNGILMLSAHWYTKGTFIQTAPEPEMIYDMFGFPEELYSYVYPAKTEPGLISSVRERLSEAQSDSDRGYDHGAYSVLASTHPEADLPVVQLSIDRSLDARAWFKIGQALAPLRDESILICGSGNIVHNLRAINPALGDQAYPECQAFDESILDLTRRSSVDKGAQTKLLHWEDLPGAGLAAASPDHLAPFFYTLGASTETTEEPEIYCQDYLWGSLSMTSYLWR